jgi:osomolarity two-component system sensor histidine kinase TcsA
MKGSFDIVLMDLTLPEVSGEEAMQKLRKSGILIPMVALSAYPASQRRDQCLEKGFNDYISKPFELGTFIHKIKVNIRKRPKPEKAV